MTTRNTIVAVAVAALISTSAMGGGLVHYNPNHANANASAGASAGASASNRTSVGVRNSNSSYNRNSNANSNRQHQGQGQGQGQEQGQGQGQMQGNVGLGSGNSTSTEVSYNEVKQQKQDIPAYAPDAIASPATAPCIATWAVSGGALGLVSAGGAGYVKDHGCALGEVARRATAMGDTETAQQALSLMFAQVKADAGIEDAPTEEEKTAARSEGKFFTDDVASSDNNFINDWH